MNRGITMALAVNQTKISNHETLKKMLIETLQKDRGDDPNFSFEIRGHLITRWHCKKPMVRVRSFFKGCPGIEEAVCSHCNYHYCLPLSGCVAPDS